MLEEVEENYKRRKETGETIMGLKTGIKFLDKKLNGLRTGLYLLGGSPGVGKTTFATQISCNIAKEHPVVYLTYENTPENLVLKSICRMAKIPFSEVDTGSHAPEELKPGIKSYTPIGRRIAYIEGTVRVSTDQIRAKALQVMNRFEDDRCLVVVDYLQKMAHQSGYEEIRANVSQLSIKLRELANRLKSPVLAITSLNRSGYKNSGLSSLKESGDLEYGADGVLLLSKDNERAARAPAKAVTMKIAKNRYGQTGNVNMIFRPDIGDFREEARR